MSTQDSQTTNCFHRAGPISMVIQHYFGATTRLHSLELFLHNINISGYHSKYNRHLPDCQLLQFIPVSNPRKLPRIFSNGSEIMGIRGAEGLSAVPPESRTGPGHRIFGSRRCCRAVAGVEGQAASAPVLKCPNQMKRPPLKRRWKPMSHI